MKIPLPAFRLSNRLQLLSVLGVILLALPSSFVLHSDLAEIQRARAEVSGLDPAWETLLLVQKTQRHRGLSNLVLGGQTEQAQALQRAAADLHATTVTFRAAMAAFGNARMRERADRIVTSLDSLTQDVSARRTDLWESFNRHTALVASELELVDDIAVTSGISLHQQPAGHFLQTAILQYLPAVAENLGQIRAQGALTLVRGELSLEMRRELSSLSGAVRSTTAIARKTLDRALERDPARMMALSEALEQAMTESDKALQLLDRKVLYATPMDYPAEKFFADLTRPIDFQFALIRVSFDALRKELESTLSQAILSLAGVLTGLLALVALAAWVMRTVMQAEAASREADLRFRAILEAAGDAIVIEDEHGRILLANPATEQMSGYAVQELVGMPAGQLLDDSQAEDDAQAATSSGAHDEEPGRLQRTARRKDGTRFPIELTRSLLQRDGSNWTISVVRDVSERRDLEQRLLQSQKMEAIGQLTGGIAHDFNNLLGVVVGNLDLLERAVAGQETAVRRVQTALKAALRGADLTRRLLAFSRKQHLDPAPVVVAEAIDNVIEMAARTLGPQIRIKREITTGLPRIFVDAVALDNVLLNLAVNARDAMPDGGLLTFSSFFAELNDHHPGVRSGEIKAGRYVCIKVSDTGHGIPDELIERVFEPFFTTKERGKGTGLGLAMVYGFARQSGGSVKIYSEEGIGTAVSLLLPVVREDVVPEGRTGIRVEPRHRAADGAIALVVDDEADLLDIAASYLTDMGYSVLRAEDAASALQCIEHQARIDLLLTDVIMPGHMNGVQLAQKVREIRPEVKIVFTSGFPSQALAERSRTRVDGPLLNKPYLRREFCRVVGDVMEGALS